MTQAGVHARRPRSVPRRKDTPKPPGATTNEPSKATQAAAERKNVQAVMELERASLDNRSYIARLTDLVSGVASSPTFIVAHLVWFVLWIGGNTLGGLRFDRYPFNLLTLAVSLEAIVLTGFVLMAQARMTQQADKRAHLDLQVNLLAEQELTAILRVQCLMAERAGIDIERIDPRIQALRNRTNVQQLADAIDSEMASTQQTQGDSK